MGCLLRFKAPSTEVTYNKIRIYRSTSKTGSYTYLATQNISDTTYYDINGTTSHWYKIDFYYTTTSVASSLSDPIQGGDVNGYCSIDDVRNITNIASTDLTDTQICNLIQFAGYQVNADVQVFREDERVSYISSERENDIDGVETIFYTKFYPLGDKNNDFEVDTSDIYVYTIDGDGTRADYTVSAVNSASLGKFTLSTAPGSDEELYITYYSSPVDMETPHQLVKTANALLAAAWGYTKLNVGKATRFRTAALTVFRDMDSFRYYHKKYIEVINEIQSYKSHLMGTVDTTQKITGKYVIPY